MYEGYDKCDHIIIYADNWKNILRGDISTRRVDVP